METSAPQEPHNCEVDQAGEQVAQRGCGVSIFEILKNSLDMVLGNWLQVILPDQGAEIAAPATLWPCDNHNSQQQTLSIAMHQRTGVRKTVLPMLFSSKGLSQWPSQSILGVNCDLYPPKSQFSALPQSSTPRPEGEMCHLAHVFSQMCYSWHNQLVSPGAGDLHKSSYHLSSMPCSLRARARGAAAPMDRGPESPGCARLVQIDLQQNTSTFCSSSLPFLFFVLL